MSVKKMFECRQRRDADWTTGVSETAPNFDQFRDDAMIEENQYQEQPEAEFHLGLG